MSTKNVFGNYDVTQSENKKLAVSVFLSLSLIVLFFIFPTFANASGLQKAQSAFETFQTDILPIVRIACILGVVGVGLGYVFDWADNKKLFRIIIGIVVIGSASEVVNLLWS